MPSPNRPTRSPENTATALHPVAFLLSGWRYRRLILRLTRRRIEARYRGSVLGAFWAVLQPLVVLAIYTFVFSTVLDSVWRSPSGEVRPFGVVFFSGLIVYSLFSECLTESPNLMESHRSYIKQAVFPTETLSWVILLSALFNFLIGFGLLMGLYVGWIGAPPPTLIFAPLVMIPVLLAGLGLSWLLSSLGVFLKDVSQGVSLAVMALLFLSPILYTADLVPERYQPYYRLNPLVPILEMWRGTLFESTPIDWPVWAGVTLLGWAIAWLGFSWFLKTRRAFADVV